MYHVRVSSPLESTPIILDVLGATTGVLNVTVHPGSSRFPDGDVVECDLLPDVASSVIHQLRALGPRERGPLSVDRTDMAVIRTHREMIRPMVSDREFAPVWEVVDASIRTNASYPISFFTLLICAGLIAAVGILTNSQILVVGAMVVGPEYNAILGTALGITERQPRPVKRGLIALGVGFGLAVVATYLFSAVIRAAGQAPRDYLLGFRPVSDLIAQPNLFSIVVAVIAGIVGVVSILQARANALIGVFISVTTIPAAAAMGLSAAFGQWSEVWGATEQLFLNVVILLGVGVVALILQRRFWQRRALHQAVMDGVDQSRPTDSAT
jgi:uncharacterized hydrophobic protein (TIGR00271 family)